MLSAKSNFWVLLPLQQLSMSIFAIARPWHNWWGFGGWKT